MSFRVSAPAKLNLFLNVVGRRPDGYHLLDSLFVFVDPADRLEGEASSTDQLSVSGEFASAVSVGDDNLVLKAVELLRRESGLPASVALRLEKNIPVAAGLGGGSVDAAAVLLALNDHWKLHWPMERLMPLAEKLGADVPACLIRQPVVVRGIGDEISLAPALPAFAVLLVNPRVPTPTPAVFRAFAQANPAVVARELPALPQKWESFAEFGAFIAMRGNDLLPAALSVTPAIADVLDVLERLPNIACSGLSGSGATCFGLFKNARAAKEAASMVKSLHPALWCSNSRAFFSEVDTGSR